MKIICCINTQSIIEITFCSFEVPAPDTISDDSVYRLSVCRKICLPPPLSPPPAADTLQPPSKPPPRHFRSICRGNHCLHFRHFRSVFPSDLKITRVHKSCHRDICGVNLLEFLVTNGLERTMK